MMAKNVVCMQDKQMQDMDILSEDAETELAMGASVLNGRHSLHKVGSAQSCVQG